MKKILANLVEKLEKLPGEDKRPNFCCFGVTDECMLRCRMCRKWQKDIAVASTGRPPSIGQWKEAIASIQKIAGEGFLINFGGGEPFLMDGILELVRYAADIGLRTNIATNAFLIDEAMAEAISISGLTTVNISLDGSTESVHDHLRGVRGTYEKVMKAIGYLHKHCQGLKKGICAAIYDLNMRDIVHLAETVESDNRLEWIYFMAAMQPNNTVEDPYWYENEFRHLWPQDKKQINLVIDRLIEFKSKGYKIVNQTQQLRAFKSYFNNPQRLVKLRPCHLSKALHISSTGDVFICFHHDRLGNIKLDNLEDLWNSGKAEGVRRNIVNCKKNCHFLINCFFEKDFPFSF
ncbi:MAG: radical SAM/SPASM domain-containing protein [Deltaproteobacteria bacterium]